jgi:hypothetical protein
VTVVVLTEVVGAVGVAEDVAVEDVAVEDVAVEDVAVEDVAVEDVAVEDVVAVEAPGAKRAWWKSVQVSR